MTKPTMNRFPIDPFDTLREEPIETDHTIGPEDPYYRNLRNGQRVNVARAEELGETETWPYVDFHNPEITKRVVLVLDGKKYLAIGRRPHFHVSLEPYGDKPLPEHLRDIGVFSNLDMLKTHITQLQSKFKKDNQ